MSQLAFLTRSSVAILAVALSCDGASPSAGPDLTAAFQESLASPGQAQDDSSCAAVRRVGVTTTPATVPLGDDFTITATPLDANGSPVVGCSLAWRHAGPDKKRGAIAIIIVGAAGGGAGAAIATGGGKKPNYP